MKMQDLQRKEQMDMEVVRSPPGGKMSDGKRQ